MFPQHYRMPLLVASGLLMWHEVGGFAGGVASSWFSDYICSYGTGNGRAVTNVICCAVRHLVLELPLSVFYTNPHRLCQILERF
jgi:hypothetical protein